MVFGEYHYKLSQGRIIIPPDVRRFFSLGIKFLLLKEGCIAGMLSLNGKVADKRGRVTLPLKIRKAARIEDEVVVVKGLHNYFEVWNEESWEVEIAQARSGRPV